MATYNGNNIFLSIGGEDVSALYTNELSFTSSNSLQEITAGAGATHVQRGKGLTDTQIELMLVYDDEELANYIEQIEEGEEYDIIYGPKTSVAGNPKFQGPMRVASVSHAVNIVRNLVGFNVSLQQSDTPTSRIHNGDTF